MPTFNLQIISEKKNILAEADTFEAALEIFEQKLRLKLTFDGDDASPYMMDKDPTNQPGRWIDQARHVYMRQ